jgi:hypothetical protein
MRAALSARPTANPACGDAVVVHAPGCNDMKAALSAAS